MENSTKKRTLDTSKWSQKYCHERVAAALAARGISPAARAVELDRLLIFMAVTGYSTESIAGAWVGQNGASIVRKGIQEGLLAKQPNTVKTTKRVTRHGASVVVIQLLILTRAGFSRARQLAGLGQDAERVQAPSNRYIRHDLLAQIRAITVQKVLSKQGAAELRLFSKKNQADSELVRPGTLHRYIPDLWLEYFENGERKGVFVEIERSAKSPEELKKFGQKVNALSRTGIVQVFFEKEASKNSFLSHGLPLWAAYSIFSVEDCEKRNIRFRVLTLENLAFLP